MNIPVFHDDQHGTAIIVAAAVYNGLRLVGKEMDAVKVVTSGAGAAAIACVDLLVALGVRRENVWMTDIAGVVHQGRNELMDKWKSVYAQRPADSTLDEDVHGAERFSGLSAQGVSNPEMVRPMGTGPWGL